MGTKSKGKSGSRNSPTATKESGFYGNSATGGHVHEDEYDEFTNQSQKRAWLKEQFPNASDDEIDEMRAAVSSWSGSGYEYIREAQQQGLTDNHYYERGEVLESIIKGSPKYYGEGKTIYRGINVTEDTYDNIISTLSRGGRISMLGTASWSSKKDVAQDFLPALTAKILYLYPKKAQKLVHQFSTFLVTVRVKLKYWYPKEFYMEPIRFCKHQITPMCMLMNM